MSQNTNLPAKPPARLDYSLTGENSHLAVERGLAEADWYQSPVPRDVMHKLLERRDGPALRDTILWFALILGSGCATYFLWGAWWAILPYAIYCVLYASTSDLALARVGPRHGIQDRLDE